MEYEQYFPLGIANPESFVGREEDINWLHKNILGKIHTLLLGPRRHGKSSLVLHTLNKYKLLHVEIDLQLCQSSRSVEEVIISGVEHLLTTICNDKESVVYAAKYFLKNKGKSWNIELIDHIEISIKPDHHHNVSENILTVLQFLDLILKQEGRDAVIFIDEIQEITHLKESFEIQGALRHFAQKSTHISFIFSGNNLCLLKHMFSQQTMPLYQLCDTISVGKLNKGLYKSYLHKVSKHHFSQYKLDQAMQEKIINKILEFSCCHPGRTNHLCLYFWRLAEENNHTPTDKDVDISWKKLITVEGKSVRTFLVQLESVAMSVLELLALDKVNDHFSFDELQQNLNKPSVELMQALQKLEEIDLIESQDGHHYSIVDPVARSIIKQYESVDALEMV